MTQIFTILVAVAVVAAPPKDHESARKLADVPAGVPCDEMYDCDAFGVDLDRDGDDDVVLLARSTMGVSDRNTIATIHMKDGAGYRAPEKLGELPGEIYEVDVSKDALVGGFKVVCPGACYAFDGKQWTTAAWKKAAKAPKPK